MGMVLGGYEYGLCWGRNRGVDASSGMVIKTIVGVFFELSLLKVKKWFWGVMEFLVPVR